MKTTSDSIDVFDIESSAIEIDYETYDTESDSITVGSQTFAATKAYGTEEEPEPEPVTDLTGTTWELNSTFDYSSFAYHIDFTSNGESFEQLISYADDDGEYFYYYSSQHSPAFGFDYDSGWLIPEYKTISITGGTDATNESLIAWLYENATLITD